MSEYEYYEFQAVDRPLSADEVRALRAISSRATISPTHFSNVYNYGSLKADPHELLARYFDVFVYLANWRYRELAFRLPKGTFDAKAAKLYALPGGLTVRMQGAYHLVIVSAESPDDETGFEDDEGRGWLATLAGLRSDLAAGDHRLRYLAWLMSDGGLKTSGRLTLTGAARPRKRGCAASTSMPWRGGKTSCGARRRS